METTPLPMDADDAANWAAQWSGPCEFCGDAHTCGKCESECEPDIEGDLR